MKLMFLMYSTSFLMMMSVLTQKLISMGGLLLTMALATTLLTSSLLTSWFAFILFLIYITGLLVLFGYFLAMTPNIHNSAKRCFKAYAVIGFPTAALIMPLYKIIGISPFKMNFEKDVISLVTQFNTMMYWFMAITLLLALIMVVSLTYKSPAPMRHYIE